MKTDIGMLSMHRKCLEILPTWMVAKALTRTSYIRTGHRTTTAWVLPSRPGRTCMDAPKNASVVFGQFGARWSGTFVYPASRLRRFIRRGPVWRCEDRVRIVYASFEALRSCTGFPDPVSMTVCPYFILRPAHIPPDSIRSPAAQMAGAGSL